MVPASRSRRERSEAGKQSVLDGVIPGRCAGIEPENLEIPGLVLTQHPGMT